MRFPRTLLTIALIMATSVAVYPRIQADELPVDPDFVQTWITPTPTETPTPTAKPVAKPAARTVPVITDADRAAVARANAQQQALVQNMTEQNRLKSLAEDSLQKFTALQTVTGSLRDELLSLDQQAIQTKANIKSFDQALSELAVQIDTLNNKLLLKEQEISKQKQALVAYVQAIYQHENVSVLQVLLSHNTFADSLDEIQNMESLELAGKIMLDQLKSAQEELRSQQDLSQQKKDNLDKLRSRLTEEQQNLENQQQEKRFLLDKTQGKEEQYQAMLAEFRQQAQAVENDIQGLRSEIAKIKDPATLADIENRFGDKFALTNPQNGAIWPVDASYKGISAYFNDSGYLKLFGFPHSAIDIPEPAQTPIRAPANGVVLNEVDRDDGGYNYLVLYHGTDDQGHDITTVFGHLPKMFVKKGDIVHKGDIIALTGGAPGTRGTGPYYTGPHLHFEVRKDGTAIDPLTWLP